MKMKPHRPAGIHPAYRVHGVDHHSKMEHHPGKTSPHPTDPYNSANAAEGIPQAPMATGTSPGMGGNMDQDGEGGPGL